MMNANANPMTRSCLQIGIAVLGSVGILTPFLPFTWATSPLSVIVGGTSRAEFVFAPIALPFFLAILILFTCARVLASGRFSRIEAIIAYGSSFIMAFATLAFTLWTFSISRPTAASEWLVLALPWITITSGIALVWWCRRRGAPSAIIALAAMQCAYMANAFFCLAIFWPGCHFRPSSNAGAFVTAITVAAYAAQVALVIVSTDKVKSA
ncbi:MAG: hypothetical protein HY322_12535 [Betaproteobacteria bacterium]|nr:hypothetical protein [Betaproteobacteria bacterium]